MGANNTDDAASLFATQRRAANIDRVLDMIPARFYLGPDCHQLIKGALTHDPSRAKTTSYLMYESGKAAAEALQAQAAAKTDASSSRSRKKKKETGPSAKETADPGSRSELRNKLEEKIAALREQRRQKQSEVDKAKAKTSPRLAPKQKEADAADGKAQPPKSNASATPKPAKAPALSRPVADEVEAGRLNFEPKKSELPFGAEIGRRGDKMKKLRSALRADENSARKIHAAEAEGKGDELRKEMALKKALARARGEKVHDDTSKLRKAQKMMDVKKKRGKEKWDARKESANADQKEKLDKRNANLKDRVTKKKIKRVGSEGMQDDDGKKGPKKKRTA